MDFCVVKLYCINKVKIILKPHLIFFSFAMQYVTGSIKVSERNRLKIISSKYACVNTHEKLSKSSNFYKLPLNIQMDSKNIMSWRSTAYSLTIYKAYFYIYESTFRKYATFLIIRVY